MINLVNNFFYEKLIAVPTIKSYMDDISGSGTGSNIGADEMAGLTDQAGGMKVSGGEAIEKAHQAWQESMSRQLDVLRAEVQAKHPGRLVVDCGATLVNQEIQLSYWGQLIGISCSRSESPQAFRWIGMLYI